jgi:hypothetical protein
MTATHQSCFFLHSWDGEVAHQEMAFGTWIENFTK